MTKNTERRPTWRLCSGKRSQYVLRDTRERAEPLVLLPGGFMTVEAMGEIVPLLAATRRVIAVELQGHGHTADIERPMRYELMADDIAALITLLGLERADIFGFSLGGGVGLQTAIQHPEVVRKLTLVSIAFKRDGWYPEVLAGMASISVEGFAGTPVHEAYRKNSPRPEAWPTVVAKIRQLLSEDYDWAEGVAALKTPTLILVGDADSIRPAHAGRDVWTAWRWEGGRRPDRPSAFPTRRASEYHARWLGSPLSRDHNSHPTAPADHHGISCCAHAFSRLTSWRCQHESSRIYRSRGRKGKRADPRVPTRPPPHPCPYYIRSASAIVV